MDKVEQEINDLLENIGVDPEEGQNPTLESEIDSEEVEFRRKEINRTIIAENAEEIEDVTETIITGNQQIKINVSVRPKCPNCGYVPTQQDDNPRLKSRCNECHSRTCSKCYSECVKCDRILCKYCTESYAGLEEDLTLCPSHADQAQKIDEFEKKFRVWKSQLETQVRLIQEELEFKELDFDRQLQERQMEQEIKIEELQQETDLAKIANEQERIRIEEKKTELEDERERQKLALENEIERRKRRLEEFEARVDAELRGREQQLKELEAERSHQLNTREQELDELEAERSHELNVREQELAELDSERDFTVDLKKQEIEEKKQQLDAMKQLMEISKEEKVQSRKDWELLIETREKMQDMKWDEINEFIDVKERLSGKDPTRLPRDGKDSSDNDSILVDGKILDDDE